jgi:hypothetical protein
MEGYVEEYNRLKKDLLRKVTDNKKAIPSHLKNKVAAMQPMSYGKGDHKILKMIEKEIDRHIKEASDTASEDNTTDKSNLSLSRKVGW